MELKVWRLHPDGCRVLPAEKTLQNTANEAAVKWCGPYANANRMGWWLFPPADTDVIWKGGRNFEYRHVSDYTDYDHHFVRSLVREGDGVDPDRWCPEGGRTKFTWGAVDDGVVQVWTGLILQTPPGWCLYVTNPVNCVHQGRLAVRGPAFSVQEGVLETDWMQYDIWVNLKFLVRDKWVYFRRNAFPPLAQIVPVPRESFQTWSLREQAVNRDTEEGERVFKFWLDYNHRKYGLGGRQRLSPEDPSLTKDSTTYHHQRKRSLSPDRQGCPFLEGDPPSPLGAPAEHLPDPVGAQDVDDATE